MKASDFLAANANSSLSEWENAVLDQAKTGRLVEWPFVAVEVNAKGKSGEAHHATFLVSSDYLSIGDSSDFIRMPLTPLAAQRVVDELGYVLPTPKMVSDTWKAASTKTTPVPMVPNRGANLGQYADHSRAIDQRLGAAPLGLVSGQKKDIVVGRLVKPGKVVIFGWYHPDGTNIQPRTNVHGDFYVDYSHGVRLVSPWMIVDNKEKKVSEVLSDPELWPLLSDEGLIPENQQRYPVKRASDQNKISLFGVEILRWA